MVSVVIPWGLCEPVCSRSAVSAACRAARMKALIYSMVFPLAPPPAFTGPYAIALSLLLLGTEDLSQHLRDFRLVRRVYREGAVLGHSEPFAHLHAAQPL